MTLGQYVGATTSFTLRSGVLVDLGRVPVRWFSPPPATKERMSILRPGTPSYDSRPMFLLILLRLIASPAPRRSRTRPGTMGRRPGTRITVLDGNIFFRRARPSVGCLQVGSAQYTGHGRIDGQVHARNARPGARSEGEECGRKSDCPRLAIPFDPQWPSL